MTGQAVTIKSSITIWFGIALGVLLLAGQAQAAVRILSAAPKSVQLQPGKTVTLSVKGSGLKTIRGGALYRDKAGKQKAGRLNVRYSGGVSSGRLTLTLAGRVNPGAYYIHLADSRGALTGLPVRATVQSAKAAKPGAKNIKRTGPVTRPGQTALSQPKPRLGKTTQAPRPGAKPAMNRTAGVKTSPQARGGSALKVSSVSPRTLQLRAGQSVTLSVRGAALNTIRRGALFTDRTGKTRAGSLGVRYVGGPSSGRLTLTAAGKLKPGSYYVQLSDSRGKPFMLPVKATVRAVSASKAKPRPQPGKPAKQVAGVRKAPAATRTSPANRAAAPAARSVVKKTSNRTLAQAKRPPVNKPGVVKQQRGKTTSRRDADLRNRERVARMGGAGTAGATNPVPPKQVRSTPALTGAGRKDPNRTDNLGNAIAAMDRVKARNGGVATPGSRDRDGKEGGSLDQAVPASPFGQTQQDATSRTSPADDARADARGLAQGGAIIAMRDPDSQGGDSAAASASVSGERYDNFAAGVEAAADPINGAAPNARKSGWYKLGHWFGSTAQGMDPYADAAQAGAELYKDQLIREEKKKEEARKKKEAADKAREEAAKKAKEAAEKKAAEEARKKANEKTGGQSTENAGGGQCTENANGQSTEGSGAGQSTEGSGGGQCTSGSGGGQSTAQPGYVSADQAPVPGGGLSARELARLRATQNRTTRAGNQINVGRDGVERADLSEARAVDGKALFGNPGSHDNTAGQAGTARQPRARGDVDYQDAPYQSDGARNDAGLMNLGSAPVNDTVASPASSSNAQGSTAASGRKQTTQAKTSGVQAAGRAGANRLAMQVGRRGGASDYAALIAPANACTALVRRVCGDANQCSSRAGCPSARQLLDRYNQTGHSADVEASCTASLEDGIIFPACSQ